jgi:hypothetical protein
MILINGYRHFVESRAGENGSSASQGQFFSEDSQSFSLPWEISHHISTYP